MERKMDYGLCIRFQLGNSFGKIKMQRKVDDGLCIRVQLGNSFWNTEMERKSTYVFVFN